jgi:hypothetical protein
MSEAIGAPVSTPPYTPPTYKALFNRASTMRYREFRSRAVAAWNDRGKSAQNRVSYPQNEDLIGFRLATLTYDAADEMMLHVGTDAGIPGLELDRFRVWGGGLRETSIGVAKLEGLLP